MGKTKSKPAAKSVRQSSASKVAAEKIKHLIITGELVADSNHLETELAERLGMSRTPVREATLTLQANGLLEVQPRKGIKIKANSLEDISRLCEILTELECMAIKAAANSGYTRADLKLPLDAIKAMEQSLLKDDRESWSRADEAFHIELVRKSNNEHLEAMIANLNDKIRRARIVILNLKPLCTKSNKIYRSLCAAIVKGDVEKAQKIHRQYRAETVKLCTKTLDQSGFRRI